MLGLGDPVGIESDRVSAIWRLHDLALEEGLDPAVWNAGPRLLKVYRDLGMTALPLGLDGQPLPEAAGRGETLALRPLPCLHRRTRPDGSCCRCCRSWCTPFRPRWLTGHVFCRWMFDSGTPFEPC